MNKILLPLLFVVLLGGAIYMNTDFGNLDGESSNGTSSGNETNTENLSEEELSQEEESQTATVVKGDDAPNFKLEGFEGSEYALKDVDKPLVINFWASWCKPCEIEAPELVKMYDKYNEDLELYAINLMPGDNIENAKAFIEKHGFEFPVLKDRKGDVADAYRVISLPTTFFINAEGVITQRVTGVPTPEQMEEMFKNLIEEKA